MNKKQFAQMLKNKPEINVVINSTVVILAWLLIVRFVGVNLFILLVDSENKIGLFSNQPFAFAAILIHLFQLTINIWALWFVDRLLMKKVNLQLGVRKAIKAGALIFLSWELLFLILYGVFGRLIAISVAGSLVLVLGMLLVSIFWLKKIYLISSKQAYKRILISFFSMVLIYWFTAFVLFS